MPCDYDEARKAKLGNFGTESEAFLGESIGDLEV
jgi:hypothetical protein